MTKPWEETWSAETLYDGGPLVVEMPRGRLEAHIDENSEAIRLAAAAPEMARILLSLHHNYPSTDGSCMFCDAYPDTQPHKERCPIGAALRKAGIPLADTPDSA